MKSLKLALLAIALLAGSHYLALVPGVSQPDQTAVSSTIPTRISPPEGYRRIVADSGSYSDWLRQQPLKPTGTPVRLYNGDLKHTQQVHEAVFDIDVGSSDLQQCADAVMRLRAEYLYSKSIYDSISFDFTSGDKASFRQWIKGIRPKVTGNQVEWVQSAEIDSSYKNFRKYLNIVFNYAGSYSLSKQMKPKTNICEIESGDVFIQGGFPGHAVLVVDVVVSEETGKRLFLLAQSYMPAQDIHILKNYSDPSISPWYDCEFGDTLETPEWAFRKEDLMRF